jgi:hypothetical protein
MKAKAVRPLNKGESAILLPGTTGAEPWEVWIFGGPDGAKCVQTCASPHDNPLRRSATLALPVSEVFCLPLWLNETDPKQFAGMIPLQLELRGLQPRGNGAAVFDWTVVAQEGTRTLVMVGALPSSVAAEVQAEDYPAFDLSARCLSFGENALTLWREQDRLTVALTRGRNLVYYQAMEEGRINERVMQDLNCIRATLAMQDILVPLQQAIVWMETGPDELALLQSGLQLPVEQMERPLPQAPARAWKLMPAPVGVAKRTREVQRWRQRGGFIVLAIYFLVVLALLGRLFATTYKVDQLRQWQSDHAQAITLVRDTRATWRELRPVVDEASYPLELLLHTSSAIPVDELHLTLFEASDGHVLIKGEAKNAAAAFQFLDKLKSDPHFTGYTWDMGQPHLLPNDLAQLQIEGTRATAN